MKKPYYIVFTTIFHPVVLEDLFKNISSYGHLNEVKVIIVGDRKTPETIKILAQSINERGLEVEYLDIDAQEKWGGKYSPFYSRLPFDNETRRNIGYLKALEEGCEVLISIDDDNFPNPDDDFIAHHAQTGTGWKGNVLSEPHGFHNICEYLVFVPERHIFPRGFPFHLRGIKNENINKPALKDTVIGVTAGLWLVEPDIDATTWIQGKVSGVEYRGEKTNVLSQSTWSPINTQNTSVTRELIPAYLCIPMGWAVPGGKIQRYGDIWGGYFLQALMQGSKYHVAFGRPLVDHRRNPHNYVDDLRHEFWGMMLTDWLVGTLKQNFKPQSDDIIKRVEELGDFLQEAAQTSLPPWCPPEMKSFLEHTAESMKHWAAACQIATKD
jgi:hypothetical protein